MQAACRPLRALVLLAACSLSLGALANGLAACKSSKPTGPAASTACVPKAKPAAKTKSASKTMAKAKTGAKKVPGKKPRHKAGAVAAGSGASATAQEQAGLPMPAHLPPGAKPLVHPESPCFTALGASTASRHLAPKVPFFLDGEPSAALLANPARPNKMEKTELSSVLAGYEMCMDMSADWRHSTYSQEASGVLDAYWQKTKAILGSLEAGKTSYGEAARAVSENDKVYKGLLDELAPR